VLAAKEEMMRRRMVGDVMNFTSNCRNYHSTGLRGDLSSTGVLFDFISWCDREPEIVDLILQRCGSGRTKKLLAAIVASLFLDCDSPGILVRLVGLKGSINTDIKNEAVRMREAWEKRSEDDIGESEVADS
jgi:hypothetical protein